MTDDDGATDSHDPVGHSGADRRTSPPTASVHEQLQRPGVRLQRHRLRATPTAPIASYAWNFGDGDHREHGATPNHTYAAAGTYPVQLTVTDDDGATGTTTT